MTGIRWQFCFACFLSVLNKVAVMADYLSQLVFFCGVTPYKVMRKSKHFCREKKITQILDLLVLSQGLVRRNRSDTSGRLGGMLSDKKMSMINNPEQLLSPPPRCLPCSLLMQLLVHQHWMRLLIAALIFSNNNQNMNNEGA